ncbi:hypothetical protein [Marinigracilibium pacificum]|uniref:Uncharacterized protein n=1 Tax=Marinigracilibium pacificum TaxID=2729599 RepID=A0A848J532_9BACT|nr:hypothetical protein [Marinigracilibium pacificum]NMM50891.1 hypothetical protein [Marinigracilibium pacificum]
MRTHPTTYLFEQTETGYTLYLGEFSSLEGLGLIPNDLEIEKIELGVSNYKNHGWATEKEFPHFRTSGELAEFLDREGEIGLLVFDVTFKNFGSLRTHDDGECHFEFRNKKDLIDVVSKAAPKKFLTQILAKILNNPDKYISIDQNGYLKMYHTFDQYIEDNQNI